MRYFLFLAALLSLSACATTTLPPTEYWAYKNDARLEKFEILSTALANISSHHIGDTSWINDAYLDEVVLSEKDPLALVEDAFQRLDDGSEYIDPERFLELRQGAGAENNAGIGVTIILVEDQITVFRVTKGSPADISNIGPGDELIAIDGRDVSGLMDTEVVRLLKGPIASEVSVTFANKLGVRTLKFIREMRTEKNVRLDFQNETPIISINAFDYSTVEDVDALIRTVKSIEGQVLDHFVIDLRWNTGGLLSETFDLANLFLDQGEVFYTQGRETTDVERFTAEKGDLTHGAKIVILVNEFTGSGAELFALSMQERGRATIVGETTFGAGLVHSVIPLRGGRSGALKIASHRLYTAGGVSFDDVGVQPDHVLTGTLDDVLKQAADIAQSEIAAQE